MNETVAIEYIDQIIVPHLNGRPGVLIWDIFRAHITPAVKDHLRKNNIKPIIVPASMTWKRQPLDTHIFAVIKKQYQAFYYQQVFVQGNQIKQIDTIDVYNKLLQGINQQLIVSAFKESILNDAKFVPSETDDPKPNQDDSMSVESDDADDAADTPEVHQYEDEPLDELSDSDDFSIEMPKMRNPRKAHSQAHDAQLALFMSQGE
jgi:hypothetical protein